MDVFENFGLVGLGYLEHHAPFVRKAIFLAKVTILALAVFEAESVIIFTDKNADDIKRKNIGNFLQCVVDPCIQIQWRTQC